MEFLAFLFTYAALIIALINFFTIRRPLYSVDFVHPVTVLVPMRNEEIHAQECLESIATQVGVNKLKVIVIDDASEDSTLAIAQEFAARDPRFSVIALKDKPADWLGKTWALNNGFNQSSGSYLVSLDADVRLEKTALKDSLHTFEKLNLDFLSVYPRQIAITFAERLVQPLLHWSWMSSLLLRFAEALPHPTTAVANGQFFIVKSSALSAVGGYESVKNEVIDDMALARKLLRARYKGTVLEGSTIASTRMYSSSDEIQAGYGKSLWKAFGGPLGSLGVITVIFFSSIAPFLLALTGNPIGFITSLFIITSRILSAIRGGDRVMDAFLHPLSAAKLISLIIFSHRNHSTITWKNRAL